MIELAIRPEPTSTEAYLRKSFEKFGDLAGVATPAGVALCGLLSGKVSEVAAGCVLFFFQEIEVIFLKQICEKDRPQPYYRDRPSKQDKESFPSGHTSSAFFGVGLAYGLYGSTSPITITAVAIAALVGLSRYTSEKHWPIDIVAGACIGVFHGFVAGHFRTLISHK